MSAADYSPLGTAYEAEDYVALGRGLNFCLDACHRIGDIESGCINHTVYILYACYGFSREAAAVKTNRVDACVADGLTGSLDKRRNVFVYKRSAL